MALTARYSVHLAKVNDRVGLTVMTAIFCLMTIFALALRFYSRRVTRAGLGPDDWLAPAALLFVLALNGIFMAATIQGAVTGHSPVVNDWPVSTPLEHLVEKYKYAFQLTEKITFGLIKMCILFLWKRMFGRVKSFRILCWVMIGITVAWSISFFFATLFQCGTNWTWNWAPITLFLTQCIETLDMLTAFTVTDVFTDFVIMFMPVPIIWKLHMPVRKKIGVSSIFMVGLFTIGAGIARVYYYLVTSYDKQDNPDFIADFTLVLLWSVIEANVAMLVCCMPTLGPVFGRCHAKLSTFIHSRSSGTSKGSLAHFMHEAARGGKEPKAPSEVELRQHPVVRDDDEEDSWPLQPPATYDRQLQGWVSGPTAVVATGDADLEGQVDHRGGILTRTEIHKTYESNLPQKEDGVQLQLERSLRSNK